MFPTELFYCSRGSVIERHVVNLVFELFWGTKLYLTAFNSKRELITWVNIIYFAVDLVWHSATARKKLWFGEWQSITEAINGNKFDIQTLREVYYGLLIQAVTDKCVLVYRWTHGFILFSVYKWKQTGKVRVGQKPRRGNKWRGEWQKKQKQGETRTHRVGSAVFCSTQGYTWERNTLRTSHNTPPPTESHHVH